MLIFKLNTVHLTHRKVKVIAFGCTEKNIFSLFGNNHFQMGKQPFFGNNHFQIEKRFFPKREKIFFSVQPKAKTFRCVYAALCSFMSDSCHHVTHHSIFSSPTFLDTYLRLLINGFLCLIIIILQHGQCAMMCGPQADLLDNLDLSYV